MLVTVASDQPCRLVHVCVIDSLLLHIFKKEMTVLGERYMTCTYMIPLRVYPRGWAPQFSGRKCKSYTLRFAEN